MTEVDIGTKLMLSKRITKIKLERLQDEKENEELQECSFKPKLSFYKRKSIKDFDKVSSIL